MAANVKLDGVSCIVPKMAKRVVSQVWYLDGTFVIVPVLPFTIIRWIARKNYIDLNRVMARSRELNFQRKGVPIPVGVHDAFMPVHFVEEMGLEHPCFGYCNGVNQVVDVLPVPEENRRSKLILHNGIELLVEMGPGAINASLAKTVATHRRFLYELMQGIPQGYSF